VPSDIILNRKTAHINVKMEFIYKCYRLNCTSKSANIRTVNLVVEHVDIVMMCSTTKFTVLIFADFDD